MKRSHRRYLVIFSAADNSLHVEKQEKTRLTDRESLSLLQHAVGGGLIQLVGQSEDESCILYCNEEGVLRGLNPSAYAADFARFLGIPVMGNYLWGDVVIVNGQDNLMTDAQVERLQRRYEDWKAGLGE